MTVFAATGEKDEKCPDYTAAGGGITYAGAPLLRSKSKLSSTYQNEQRHLFRSKYSFSYDDGPPCIFVAHSL